MGWGSTYGVFYCSSLILRRYGVCVFAQKAVPYFILGF